MIKHLLSFILFFLFSLTFSFSQSVRVEGYVYALDNSGYVKQAEVTILTLENVLKGKTTTNAEGYFAFDLEEKTTYKIKVRHSIFRPFEEAIKTPSISERVLYLNLGVERAAGYIFEATIADWRPENSTEPVDAIEGANITVYNITEKRSVLSLENHTSHTFSFHMKPGNQYTILLSKEGYFNKRIEANVAIDGCILCVEGVGITRPGIADNLSNSNQTGTLGANISMEKIAYGKPINMENIYFDQSSSEITPLAAAELDNLIEILIDNPLIKVEIASHTDSRGSSKLNMELSQERAKNVLQYILDRGISEEQVTAKGYGEIRLVNHCKDGVDCTEAQHRENRRTTFTVVPGKVKNAPTLKESMDEEMFEAGLAEVINQEVYIAPESPKQQTTSTFTTVSKVKDSGPQSISDPFEMPVQVKSASNKSEKKVVNSKAKAVSSYYSGYKIEVLNTIEPLTESDQLFKEMGGIEFDETEDGGYSYMIGDFSSLSSAEHFLKIVIQPRYPSAKIVQYAEGKRAVL